ncbi:MAG: flavin reductase [Candidatus Promineifilaceae bacterium]|nr:flavin reductase [Candidatus Promineifilaceae bacterium]
MAKEWPEGLVSLSMDGPIWDEFFTVAPLVLVGTRDQNGDYNHAPKHMVLPLGWDNYFAFVCTPDHATYHNIRREGSFTVTYPRPSQVLLTTLAAAPRLEDDVKVALMALPTFPAQVIDGQFVKDGYLFLECALDRVIDAFGRNSLITARIVAAHVHDVARRDEDRDDSALLNEAPLLAYLEPGRFATVAQTFAFPFPKDFSR